MPVVLVDDLLVGVVGVAGDDGADEAGRDFTRASYASMSKGTFRSRSIS
ncbi:hypothetical protein ACFQYP_61955 [Nonomuraea antimicrobica]